MIQYNIIDGALPEGSRIISDKGIMKIGGVFPLDPSLNPPVFNTPSSRLGILDELVPVSIDIDVDAQAGKSIVGLSVINGTLPWGLKITGSDIVGTPAELFVREPASFLPEDAPQWETRSGLVLTAGEQEQISFQLLAPSPREEIVYFFVKDGFLPNGVKLQANGTLYGKTGEAEGEVEPAGPGPLWDTARGRLGSYNEFAEVDINLVAIPRTGDHVYYRVSKGNLPSGLKLSNSTGDIYGTTSELMSGESDIDYSTRPTLASRSFSGTANQAFSSVLNPVFASGRTLSEMKVTSGFMPVGLKLNGTTISGTPLRAGSYTFSITVIDSMLMPSIPTTFTFEVTA